MLFSGIPDFAQFAVVSTRRRFAMRHDALPMVVFHGLGDLVNAMEQGVRHYFPLTLREGFLQNSSLGTPYQKWAKFTNDDFAAVDACLKRLLPAMWTSYHDPILPLHGQGDRDHSHIATLKDAWFMMDAVKDSYRSCVIDPSRPDLAITALCINRWVGADGIVFNHCNRSGGPHPAPPVMAVTQHAIMERSVIAGMAGQGAQELARTRAVVEGFRQWIASEVSVFDLLNDHQGTLLEGLFAT